MAHRVHPSQSVLGHGAGHIRILGAGNGVRPVDHAESPSRDDLGKRVFDFGPASENTPWQNGRVARFRHLGAKSGKSHLRLSVI